MRLLMARWLPERRRDAQNAARVGRIASLRFPVWIGLRTAPGALCASLLLMCASASARDALPPAHRKAALEAAIEAPVLPGARPRRPAAASPANPAPAVETPVRDDRFAGFAKDLQLSLDGERKAEAASRFMHGLMLEDSSDPDQALGEYLKALALDPANVDLAIKLAWEYIRRSDSPSAINLLKDTIKASPRIAEPYLALAYLYFNTLNKPDLAQKYALQGLDIDPGNIYGYQYLREIYKASGQTQKIPPLLDRGAKADSNDPEFWLRLGSLYADTFLKDGATKDSENLKKTTAIFQKALALGNDDANVVQRVADFYVAAQQLPLAIPLYKHVIEIDPSHNLARENLARCYLGIGQKEQAAATLEDLIKADPVQHEAYEMLAKIYEETGQYEKAIADYEQSLLISPRRPQAYESLALLLLQQFKKPDKAIPVLAEARKRFADQPWFTFLLAVALEQNKQHQPSLEMFEQAVVEAQNVQPAMLNSNFYFQYGEAAEQAGLYDRAGELLRKSLDMEEDPQAIANTANYLGYMWVDHNEHLEEGGALIKRALEIAPGNGAYLDSMGWYYYHTNQFDKALPELKRAVELVKPEDPVVYEHLGDVYGKLNDTANAVGAWQKALDLDPTNPNIPALNKKIAEAKSAPAPTPGASPK